MKKMKTFFVELKHSVLATVILCLIVSGLYPVLVWGLGQILFPRQANGSLLENRGALIGSSLIAQGFSGAQYFHPRPSAISTYPYDVNNSGGSNLGPTSKKLRDTVGANLAAYRKENGLDPQALVPADAVTASGSGLDPDISPANAQIQASRVAQERGLKLEAVETQIMQATGRPPFGFVGGAEGVNVLELNLALDRLTGNQPKRSP
jgi:potassium-transporting ATPase KdpC subunit